MLHIFIAILAPFFVHVPLTRKRHVIVEIFKFAEPILLMHRSRETAQFRAIWSNLKFSTRTHCTITQRERERRSHDLRETRKFAKVRVCTPERRCFLGIVLCTRLLTDLYYSLSCMLCIVHVTISSGKLT